MKSGMITDCEIKNPLTGAVYLTGQSRGTLNGGTIQKITNLGNNLRGQNQLGENSWYGTVVIDDATFEMNGGTIKDNINKQGFISTAGVLVTVEQNDVSEENAKKSYFTMNGGTISGNSSVDGGGVYVASAKNEINGGKLENNKADRQGGGYYVGSVPYSLNINNVAITKNDASIIGGGVWIYPTGNVKAFLFDGAAIYSNTAQNAAADAAFIKNNNKHSIVLSDQMLGGGDANWYKDGT